MSHKFQKIKSKKRGRGNESLYMMCSVRCVLNLFALCIYIKVNSNRVLELKGFCGNTDKANTNISISCFSKVWTT